MLDQPLSPQERLGYTLVLFGMTLVLVVELAVLHGLVWGF